MTGTEAISYIHSMVWDRKATGYEHASNLLERMGNPEKKLKYVHIGGTNGKGSTAAMLASVLQEAGYKTGLYTSPYIYRFHERMQVNGKQISDEQLAQVTEYVKGYVETMDTNPSEFALVCCIAFEYFAREDCDIVVLEVGMGGENDSTNVIECPEVAVLTNIGLDHTEYLGDTLEAIALTKAGIVKNGGRVVAYPSGASVEKVLKEVCKVKKADIDIVDFQSLSLKERSLKGQTFGFESRNDISLQLLGEHQLHNAAVVIRTIEMLRKNGWEISEHALKEGIYKAKWQGRFEVICEEPTVIVDGGHNLQCIEALAENIKQYLHGKKIIAVTGVLADKDYEEMYRALLPLIDTFICMEPDCPRKLDAAVLAECICHMGGHAISTRTTSEAIATATELAGKEDVILFFGSLYAIGEVRNGFRKLIDLH